MNEQLVKHQNLIAVTNCGIIKMKFAELTGVNMKSHRLRLDWDLNYLSGIAVHCQYSRKTGILKKNFTVHEPISVSYIQS
jgi:hypothetical protein